MLGHAQALQVFKRLGSAASLEAVEKAIRKGSRTASMKRRRGMRAMAITAPSTTTTKKISAAHSVGHQLAEAHQHRQAVLTHGGRDGSENADGREPHHVVRVTEHDGGKRVAQLQHRPRPGADGRAGRAEQEREHDDLQHFAARHRVDDAGGERCAPGFRTAAELVWTRRRHLGGSATPTPGCTRFTAARPTNSAMVVTISK